jgi:hypothetical protein
MLTESETIESTSAWEWWTSPLASSGRRSRSLRALAIASMLPHRAGDEAPPSRPGGGPLARSIGPLAIRPDRRFDLGAKELGHAIEEDPGRHFHHEGGHMPEPGGREMLLGGRDVDG